MGFSALLLGYLCMLLLGSPVHALFLVEPLLQVNTHQACFSRVSWRYCYSTRCVTSTLSAFSTRALLPPVCVVAFDADLSLTRYSPASSQVWD